MRDIKCNNKIFFFIISLGGSVVEWLGHWTCNPVVPGSCSRSCFTIVPGSTPRPSL